MIIIRVALGILILLEISSCGDPPTPPMEGSGVIQWSNPKTNGRSSLRNAVLFDKSDNTIFVVYEFYGRHNDNEEQPKAHKYSFHVLISDGNGSVIDNSIKVMSDPRMPMDQDFVPACLHGPYRSMVKFKIINENGKRIIVRGINEVDSDYNEKYEIPAVFKIAVSYDPMPRDFIGKVVPDNYLADQVTSNWIECK